MKIPHISSGKTTQFFFGYQHTQIHSGSRRTPSQLPPPPRKATHRHRLCRLQQPLHQRVQWSGLCNTASQQIYNPFSGVAYTNNHIPSSDFDAAALAFEKHFPTATTDAAAGKIGNIVNYFSATQNYFNEYDARVDHKFGANDHLFGHYFYDWYQQPAIYNPANL